MANERKTENIVRKHFTKFENECLIEEQKSENPKIDKMLKNASKKGSGVGHPEFIISVKDNPEFLIVVECKAKPSKHESKTRDKYSDYAVDGVLLYASFLSKEYDVLVIAVSGQNKRELKISHYLWLKGEKKPVPFVDDNELLSIESYLNGYLESDEKLDQDYDKLLVFSKALNKQLHSHKIQGSRRSLLLSGILIALEDPAFKEGYTKHDEPEDLAEHLVNTVSSVLKKAKIEGKKLNNLKQQYSFIKTDTALGEKHFLRDLISSIDKNINNFRKSRKYFDVLGKFYIEFLRYAYSEKGLGIVLTPSHITELFSDLAEVNKNSIVYDNCCGTGGFLINALSKMINDTGDREKERQIKAKQIVGVEYQDDIFALAVSNMYIHQDGKTNIINGSCFDDEVMEQVKKYKPTVGFLNPPYKQKEGELAFVMNNLECIEIGGTCIAIVPMERALAQTGKVFELKKKLLEKHTLEAVLSMPNELFSDSETNVVSCVMIFTAHKPHLPNKETYFGYYKDDGFVKRKPKGRIDAFKKWESIKEEWVLSYINRKTKAGFSVNKVVTPNDEWCAETYIETDYSKLKKEDFKKTLKEFVLFNELFLKD